MTAYGVLGGSFDPVHNGHLAVAQSAFEHFALARVKMVPAGKPPHKAESVKADAHHRLAMLTIATERFDFIDICAFELSYPGPSYTIDTLTYMKDKHPDSDIYFIIGSDNVTEIPGWYRYTEILAAAVLCVTLRPGSAMEIPPQLKDARIKTFPSPMMDISSSQIRENIARGISCETLLPENVKAYIDRNALYR
ncbi:MAG: nicotinate (nicotinamide) nucleotide adenylyltransferase [Chitinivibrionales bacterium]|nr:nicotinate (nicotinamide) nucleotide adenylyltransferase [Chitinivibrionales bacterium]